MKKAVIIVITVALTALIAIALYMTRDIMLDVDDVTVYRTKFEVMNLKSKECQEDTFYIMHKYDGIKDSVKEPVTVKYYFDLASEELTKISVEVKVDDDRSRQEAKAISFSTVGQSVSRLDRAESVIIEITKEDNLQSSDTKDFLNKLEGAKFDISSIDWNASRDDVKANATIASVYDDDTEEMKPIQYEYVGIKDISDFKTAVCYYFNEDNSILSVVLFTKYLDSTLTKALEYYDISKETYEASLETAKEDYDVEVRHEEDDELIIVMWNK